MNTKQRFSDEESAPQRGVDGLLDELGRYRAGDDIFFLGELERKLDAVDRAAAINMVRHGKPFWRGASVAKVAALLAIAGTAVYSLKEPLGFGGPSFRDFRLGDDDQASTETYEAAPGRRSASVPMGSVEEQRIPSDLWKGPVVSPMQAAVGPASASEPAGPIEFGREVETAMSYRSAGADAAASSDDPEQDKAVAAAHDKMLAVMAEFDVVDLSTGMPPWADVQQATDARSKQIAKARNIEARLRYEQALSTADFVKPGGSGQVRYPALVDNPFCTPEKDPLSTFSIDVDTASYSNVRRMIQSGEAIPPDAVRIEEFINYFDYDYAEPGDELPFSVNLESAACPWKPEHRLVRVGLKGREIQAGHRQSMNLVFLVDVSGSMNQERKLPLVQRSLHLLIDELREDDRITIVTYAGQEGVALAPTSGANKAAMHSAVDRLQSSDGTNGEAGIKLAYRLASENFSDGGVNRILLATDGDFNLGVSSTTALRDMVQEEARRGVFLSVLGFGSDNLNDAMLETITNDGNGTYHYIDSVSEGRRVLVEDLTSTMITIAKDVKIQIEFNPATVGAYHLVGYANRKLPPEAFNDDRVDAGDIGAGHTVTAFYEIIPPGLAVPEVDNLKYQVPVPVAPDPRSVATTGSAELFTIKLRYKAPQGTASELIQVPFTDRSQSFETASSDFRFAASVAAFGLQLRQSPFRGNLSRDQVIAIAKACMGSDPRRVEFAELIANAIVQRTMRLDPIK